MDPKKLRIVFMGTPELAAHCLDSLCREGYHIAGVVTAADKPAGRGRKIRQSTVKQTALDRGLPLLQPLNLKSPEFIEALKDLKPQLQVVVAFRMLPESVWELPPLGTFNMHASLLPQYRGAAPINHVIINGETETGVTTFLLDRRIDTGRILFREAIPVDEDETAGSLHEKIKPAAAAIIRRTIDALATGEATAVDQEQFMLPGEPLKPAPKIHREDCLIDWQRPGREVVRRIRGLSPQPGAWCEAPLRPGSIQPMKILSARFEPGPTGYPAGTLLTDNREVLAFATPDGRVRVEGLQVPGKKPMPADAFLRGFRFGNPLLTG